MRIGSLDERRKLNEVYGGDLGTQREGAVAAAGGEEKDVGEEGGVAGGDGEAGVEGWRGVVMVGPPVGRGRRAGERILFESTTLLRETTPQRCKALKLPTKKCSSLNRVVCLLISTISLNCTPILEYDGISVARSFYNLSLLKIKILTQNFWTTEKKLIENFR